MRRMNSTVLGILAVALPVAAQADVFEVRRDDVLPVVMQSELNFRSTHSGDRFWANVDDNRMAPRGTRLEGRVIHVEQKHGDRPGYMDLEFTTIVLPDGN